MAEQAKPAKQSSKAAKWTNLVSVRVWDLTGGYGLGSIGRPKQLTSGKADRPAGQVLSELVGSAPRCRVRISPSGKIIAVPVVPRETVLQAEVLKGGFLTVRDLATGSTLYRFDEFSNGVGPEDFRFSPDQKKLAASGFLETGAPGAALFAWDVSSLLEKTLRAKSKLSSEQMNGLWAKFAENDGGQAYRALRQLASVPELCLPFLKEHIRPAPDREPEITVLIPQLTDAKLGAKSQESLVGIGEDALPALEQALKNASSDEKKQVLSRTIGRIKEQGDLGADTRQVLWTLELLEFMASSDSVALLEELAKGSGASWLTQEARASLKRVQMQTSPN